MLTRPPLVLATVVEWKTVSGAKIARINREGGRIHFKPALSRSHGGKLLHEVSVLSYEASSCSRFLLSLDYAVAWEQSKLPRCAEVHGRRPPRPRRHATGFHGDETER
jgi:hypothetical protein